MNDAIRPMRDALLDTLCEQMAVDPDIFLLSGDFGSPALSAKGRGNSCWQRPAWVKRRCGDKLPTWLRSRTRLMKFELS